MSKPLEQCDGWLLLLISIVMAYTVPLFLLKIDRFCTEKADGKRWCVVLEIRE